MRKQYVGGGHGFDKLNTATTGTNKAQCPSIYTLYIESNRGDIDSASPLMKS
jgi:hypothetical protein